MRCDQVWNVLSTTQIPAHSQINRIGFLLRRMVYDIETIYFRYVSRFNWFLSRWARTGSAIKYFRVHTTISQNAVAILLKSVRIRAWKDAIGFSSGAFHFKYGIFQFMIVTRLINNHYKAFPKGFCDGFYFGNRKTRHATQFSLSDLQDDFSLGPDPEYGQSCIRTAVCKSDYAANQRLSNQAIRYVVCEM